MPVSRIKVNTAATQEGLDATREARIFRVLTFIRAPGILAEVSGYSNMPEYRPLKDTDERNALYEELRVKEISDLRRELEELSGDDVPSLSKQVLIAEIISLRLKS
jgi:hypothetical protein